MSDRRRHWTFVLPWLASGLLAGGSYDPPRSSEWAIAAAPVLGLAMGGLWQVLDRRDLADRLIVPAVLSLFGIAAGVLARGGSIRVGMLLYAVGLVAGLVLAEQWLRRRRDAADSLVNESEQRGAPVGS